MPKYILLVNWTDKGITNVKESPQRLDLFKKSVEAAGSKVTDFYLTMGRYDTWDLPIYQYLHSDGAPNYVVADHFFQAAFGGSFLNHQYLVAARAPIDTAAGGAAAALHSVVDANGFPNAGYPLYKPTTTVKDAQLTQACGLPTTNPKVACGDYAVNTIQPANPPAGGGAVPAHRVAARPVPSGDQRAHVRAAHVVDRQPCRARSGQGDGQRRPADEGVGPDSHRGV